MIDPKADTVDGTQQARQDLALPDYVGPYQILEQIGLGGMGQVLLGESRQPKRRVAIKMMLNEHLDADALGRFAREMDVLARLEHPGIARLFESGTALINGRMQPWYAMEFVDGLPLDTYVQRRQLSVREVLKLVAQIADALQHAHQKGVVHRDIKPSNILVSQEGQCKLLDFGIARLQDADALRQTRFGQVVGTLAYMSPEQLKSSSDIDVRSDIYALGVVLYELLTGHLPIALSTTSLLEAIRELSEGKRVPMSARNPQLSGEIEWIVDTATQTELKDRYDSAASFRADIENFLSHRPLRAKAPSTFYGARKFIRRNPVLVGATFATALALIGATWLSVESANRANAALKLAEQRYNTAHGVISEVAFKQADLLKHLPKGREIQQQTLLAALQALDELQAEQPENDRLKTDRASLNVRLADLNFSFAGLHLDNPEGAISFAKEARRIYEGVTVAARDKNYYIGNARSYAAEASALRSKNQLEASYQLSLEAIAVNETAARNYPNERSVWNQLGNAYYGMGSLQSGLYKDFGQPNAALEWFEKAEAAHRKDLALSTAAKDQNDEAFALGNIAAVLGARAIAHSGKLEFAKTTELLEQEFPVIAQALQLAPENANMRAEANVSRNNWINAALELDNAELLATKGVALADELAQGSQALYLENPDNPTSYSSYVRPLTPIGHLYVDANLPEKAAPILQTAVTELRKILADKEDPFFRIRLGRTLWLQARIAKQDPTPLLIEAETEVLQSGMQDRNAKLLLARIGVERLQRTRLSAKLREETSAQVQKQLEQARSFGAPSPAQLVTENTLARMSP
jgi:serine/threonine protein kinase